MPELQEPASQKHEGLTMVAAGVVRIQIRLGGAVALCHGPAAIIGVELAVLQSALAVRRVIFAGLIVQGDLGKVLARIGPGGTLTIAPSLDGIMGNYT
ncbi:hypothetical protein ColLi_05659 [Colletotrichum liriopes]|uniref:Uncharacterized protein n=1 Tax=Colletotrichum liriopes TaxID=708192 RepID=A0AA37GM20_9PEZI|nr:hypothetical protein ColLi_05659 [Colletotrichum liriopes]